MTERARFIGRVRTMAKRCADGYLDSRFRLSYPMLHGEAKQTALAYERARREAAEQKQHKRQQQKKQAGVA